MCSGGSSSASDPTPQEDVVMWPLAIFILSLALFGAPAFAGSCETPRQGCRTATAPSNVPIMEALSGRKEDVPATACFRVFPAACFRQKPATLDDLVS